MYDATWKPALRSEVRSSTIKQRKTEFEFNTWFWGEACVSVTLAKNMLQELKSNTWYNKSSDERFRKDSSAEKEVEGSQYNLAV